MMWKKNATSTQNLRRDISCHLKVLNVCLMLIWWLRNNTDDSLVKVKSILLDENDDLCGSQILQKKKWQISARTCSSCSALSAPKPEHWHFNWQQLTRPRRIRPRTDRFGFRRCWGCGYHVSRCVIFFWGPNHGFFPLEHGLGHSYLPMGIKSFEFVVVQEAQGLKQSLAAKTAEAASSSAALAAVTEDLKFCKECHELSQQQVDEEKQKVLQLLEKMDDLEAKHRAAEMHAATLEQQLGHLKEETQAAAAQHALEASKMDQASKDRKDSRLMDLEAQLADEKAKYQALEQKQREEVGHLQGALDAQRDLLQALQRELEGPDAEESKLDGQLLTQIKAGSFENRNRDLVLNMSTIVWLHCCKPRSCGNPMLHFKESGAPSRKLIFACQVCPGSGFRTRGFTAGSCHFEAVQRDAWSNTSSRKATCCGWFGSSWGLRTQPQEFWTEKNESSRRTTRAARAFQFQGCRIAAHPEAVAQYPAAASSWNQSQGAEGGGASTIAKGERSLVKQRYSIFEWDVLLLRLPAFVEVAASTSM